MRQQLAYSLNEVLVIQRHIRVAEFDDVSESDPGDLNITAMRVIKREHTELRAMEHMIA